MWLSAGGGVGGSRIGALETTVLRYKEQTASVNLNVCHPLYVNAARNNKTDRPQTQHFLIVIQKATCFCGMIQPSSGF